MRHAAFLPISLSVFLFPAVAVAQQVEDQIVVTTDHAPLGFKSHGTGSVSRGEILVVQAVSGDRFLVRPPIATTRIDSGWIRRSDVIPFSRALGFFDEEIKRNPTSRAYAGRAIIWEESHKYDRAIADFSEAIRLDPKEALLYGHRGQARCAINEFDKAISDFNTAIRLNANNARLYANRGGAWTATLNYDKAIADYTEAIRLDPKNAIAYDNRGSAWGEMNKFDKAIADFNQAIRIAPMDASAYTGRGHAWAEKMEINKAIDDFTQAICLNPNDAAAYDQRGDAWCSKAEYDKGIDDFTESLRLNPSGASVYASRGDAWTKKKKFDRAVDDYDQAIRLDAKSPVAWRGRAWLEATCPDPQYRNGKQAVADAKTGCELTGWKDEWYLGTLAAAYAESGDFKSAVGWQTKAIELAPPEMKAALGAVLERFEAHKPYHR